MSELLYGFSEQKLRSLDEIGAKLHEYVHEKSGARLVWLEREDENKTFGIAFRTLPWDDTGVFHILEHSVLCGSDRYPVREPFVELMKGSLNTFLNAMTFPDKTCYPVSSRNDQDFLNLTRVYLDAVFKPSIYSKPEILGQEGWHFELDENGKPSYKGVVFNEMKGAFADPDEQMFNEMQRALFPDNCYRFVSGGDPAAIPTLTYEAFLSGHRRFYHPSNSYIFLDGDVKLSQVLPAIDEYLREYTAEPQETQIAYQKPVNAGVRKIRYELDKDDMADNRVRLGYGYVIGDFADRKKIVAMDILTDVICGNNHTPLTRRLLSEGLAEDVSFQFESGIMQPMAMLQVQNIREADLEKVEFAVRDELQKLAKDGLDHDQIEAALANAEFKMRERDYGTMPRGLVYAVEMMGTWLYDGDPAANLTVGTLFDELRQAVKDGWFEQLIETELLNNPHCCEVQMFPSKTLGDENRAAEQARLDAAEATWSDETRQELRAFQDRLELWQKTPDTPEALATIPRVGLDAIPEEPEHIETKLLTVNDTAVLLHPIHTGGIVYANLYFNINGFTAEDLRTAAFLTSLLQELETQKYSNLELTRQIRLLLGSLSISVNAISGQNTAKDYSLQASVSFSALESKLPEAVALVAEILCCTKFTAKDQILELLKQSREALNQRIVNAGHAVSMNRVMASFQPASAAAEYAGGIDMYRWLKDTEESYDELADGLCAALVAVQKRIFTMDRLTLGITTTMDGASETVLSGLAAVLPAEGADKPGENVIGAFGRQRVGIVIPADISFAGHGGNLLDFGGAYTGTMMLATHVISLAYLWNAVRVQGGAYGVGMNVRNNGMNCCYSYRDPSAKNALTCYRQSAQFLRQFVASGADLTGMIIGAISNISPLLTPRLMGAIAETRILSGVTEADRVKFWQELIHADGKALLDCCDAIEQAMENGATCVIGSEKQLQECGELLDSIEPLWVSKK